LCQFQDYASINQVSDFSHQKRTLEQVDLLPVDPRPLHSRIVFAVRQSYMPTPARILFCTCYQLHEREKEVMASKYKEAMEKLSAESVRREADLQRKLDEVSCVLILRHQSRDLSGSTSVLLSVLLLTDRHEDLQAMETARMWEQVVCGVCLRARNRPCLALGRTDFDQIVHTVRALSTRLSCECA
jgi:hypothetical protein